MYLFNFGQFIFIYRVFKYRWKISSEMIFGIVTRSKNRYLHVLPKLEMLLLRDHNSIIKIHGLIFINKLKDGNLFFTYKKGKNFSTSLKYSSGGKKLMLMEKVSSKVNVFLTTTLRFN